MEKNKKRKFLIVLGIILVLLLMVGTSYALWSTTAIQSGVNEIQSDCLSLTIENSENEINLTNAFPLTDEEAEKLTPYTFMIKNNCNTSVNYTVKLEKLQKNNEQTLDSSNIAIEFNNAQKQILSDYPQGTSTYKDTDAKSIEARELIKGTIKGNETRNYQLKLWMDEHVTAEEDVMNKIFRSKIVIDGGMNNVADYTEPILHGADPVLESSSKQEVMLTSNTLAEEPTTTDKLIPVVIDDEGTVTKANLKEEWYNYEEKKWANAVILANNTKEYKDGETIPEEEIESYFVWIPKYRYKLWDLGETYIGLLSEPYEEKSHAIEIDFGTTDTIDENQGECTTPGVSGDSGNCDVGEWMTHPAFLAFPDSKGMWVGKFETHNAGNTKVQIKPNVYSWRNITVKDAFDTSYNYLRKLDSHMMKNTEWGAAAYLSHSIYGSCDSKKCTEIRINNNSGYVTGYAATEEPTTGYNAYNGYENKQPTQDGNNTINYTNPDSKVASTTRNYSGVYDMNGGSWEYVMGVMKGLNNIDFTFGQSGFSTATFPFNDVNNSSKYYDVYNYYETNAEHWNRRILGDATGELGPFSTEGSEKIGSWYGDESLFVYLSSPWFNRGGGYLYGTGSGIFEFNPGKGVADGSSTFRIVLTP